MPVIKLSARQEPVVAICDFTYADVVSGTYSACVDLPLNAIVVRGNLFITTLFNSATTDTFSIGDKVGSAAATATTYSATSSDITATGNAVTLVPNGIKTTAATSVGVVWTGTGAAPSAGVGKLVVEYIIDGKEDSTYDL